MVLYYYQNLDTHFLDEKCKKKKGNGVFNNHDNVFLLEDNEIKGESNAVVKPKR